MKAPLDPTPYPQDARSKPLDANTPDGGYVYVRDLQGNVFILPDGPHLHPAVLGGGRPAAYAGDLTVLGGWVVDLTNLSGTFQFDSPEGLIAVAEQIRRQGMGVAPGAVRFFPADGSRPVTLE
jgi:hypothetical protein